MAEPTINGLNEAVQNRETVTFTPGQGTQYGGRYEGPAEKVYAKLPLLAQAGYAVTFTHDASPVATLEFSTPTGSSGRPTTPNADYIDNFSFSRNTVQKELLLSDHPLIAALNAENFDELKDYIAHPDSYYEKDGFTLTGVVSFDAAVYLFDLFRSGVRSVEVKQPVLRVTRTTNPHYDAPFDVSNVDQILSNATLISDSGLPSNFAIPILDLAQVFIDRAGGITPVRTDQLILKFGWLKDTITGETAGRSRNQYVLEYKFGLWDTKLFGNPI